MGTSVGSAMGHPESSSTVRRPPLMSNSESPLSLHVTACNGSKAAPCGRGQFESPTPSKNDASGPEQVGGAVLIAPPEQVLLTRSLGLSGAQSPAPRGVFCFCALTDPMPTHPRNPSQTPFRLRTSWLTGGVMARGKCGKRGGFRSEFTRQIGAACGQFAGHMPSQGALADRPVQPLIRGRRARR